MIPMAGVAAAAAALGIHVGRENGCAASHDGLAHTDYPITRWTTARRAGSIGRLAGDRRYSGGRFGGHAKTAACREDRYARCCGAGPGKAMRAKGNRRERGAYYTPPNLAAFVAEWAIRSSGDTVLDPSAGLGSLVIAAARRAQALGGTGPPRVAGVELHEKTFERLVERCAAAGIAPGQLRMGEFFAASRDLGKVDVVLTNPPYVRHHEFPKGVADKMRGVLRTGGSSIDGRSSSWAYFVIRSMQLLHTGGRLAAIVPGELVGSDYGRRIINEVGERFDKTLLVRCEGDLFGDLQLTTLLILGDGYRGAQEGRTNIYGCTVAFDDEQPTLPAVKHMVRISDTRQSTAMLFSRARPADLQLVDGATQADGLSRLGEVGSVTIGYVTGDSSFFHFTENERIEASLRRTHLKRAVHRGIHVQGSVFRCEDWQTNRDGGRHCWLLHPLDNKTESVKGVIARGVDMGVSTRMKCRTREPWWRVPLAKVPMAIFVYLGKRPRIVENRAQAYAANSFFTLTIVGTAASLAVGSMTSVFQLSALMAARRLGGGLRKLHVSDVAALPIPSVEVSSEVCDEIDLLIRDGSWKEAIGFADDIVLKGKLGWSSSRVEEWESRLRRLTS